MTMHLETIKILDMDDNVMRNTDMAPALQDITFRGRLTNMPKNKFKHL